jgi:hypothetical protein
MEPIKVTLPLGLKTSVKVGRDHTGRLDLDGRRQADPQRREELGRIMRPNRVEVKHLAVRVHPSVGPPAAVDPYRTFEDLRQPGLDHVLHGVGARLTLPAFETAPVVSTDALPAPRTRLALTHR